VKAGEVTIPDINVKSLIITGLKPHAKYELQMTGGRANWRGGLFNGIPQWNTVGDVNGSGVLYLPFNDKKDGRLRIRLLNSD
jgi:hypothetical protein